MYPMRGSDEEKLDSLFRAYARACPAPEASPNFMPNLWQRIESRQKFTFSFRRMANAFATAAVALSIALGVYMSIPRNTSNLYAQTYIEALADADPLDTPEIVAPVRVDLTEPGR
jgi:ABC-type nitrate/sulfonate/bicarbonate transport system permease component